jgi:hypothetical protein
MTGGIVVTVLLAALVLVPAWFVLTSWSRGRVGTGDRLAAVVGAVEAGTAILLFQHVVAASTPVPLGLWAAAVLLLAAGVVGIALRWPHLPVLRNPAKRRSRTVGAVIAVAVCAAIVVLVLLTR